MIEAALAESNEMIAGQTARQQNSAFWLFFHPLFRGISLTGQESFDMVT
jgi:hypothetical protein